KLRCRDTSGGACPGAACAETTIVYNTTNQIATLQSTTVIPGGGTAPLNNVEISGALDQVLTTCPYASGATWELACDDSDLAACDADCDASDRCCRKTGVTTLTYSTASDATFYCAYVADGLYQPTVRVSACGTATTVSLAGSVVVDAVPTFTCTGVSLPASGQTPFSPTSFDFTWGGTGSGPVSSIDCDMD